jgi:hypothetical protein
MENKNFFIENKLLLQIFVYSLILLAVLAAVTYRGLLLDNYFPFIEILKKEIYAQIYYFWHDISPINFSNRLLALPYNFLNPFFPNSPIIKNQLYTFSYMIMPLFATIANYYCAKRTKRFDIATISFLFYSLFTLPASVNINQQLYFATPLFLIFIQYFLSTQKLYKLDIAIISIIAIFLLQSSPALIVPLCFVFIASIIFSSLKNTINKPAKIFIGLSSLISLLYMNYKYFLYTKLDYYVCPSYQDVFRNFSENILNQPPAIILSIVALILVFVPININKKSSKTIVLAVILFTLYSLFELFDYSSLSINSIQNISFVAFLFVSIITIIILFLEKFFTENFIKKMLLISCIVGFINCFQQYAICLKTYQYINFLEDKISNSQGLIKIDKKDYQNKEILSYDSLQGTMLRSLILSKGNEIESLLIPSDYYKNNDFNIYDENNIAEENIILQGNYIPLSSQYWNFDKIIPLLDKIK